MSITALAAVFLCTAAPVRANNLIFSDGDPISSNYFYNEYIGSTDTNIYNYSNFVVPPGYRWDVSDLVIDLGVDGAATITSFNWDLRTGMNGSNGGTDIASGSISGDGTAYRTLIPSLTVNSEPVYHYVFPVSNSTLANLTSGQTYWLAIYPVVPNGYNIWLPVTDHTNALNSLQDNVSEEYYFSSSLGVNFLSEPRDYAVGLEGTEESPEPAPVLTVAVMLCLLGVIRRVGKAN